MFGWIDRAVMGAIKNASGWIEEHWGIQPGMQSTAIFFILILLIAKPYSDMPWRGRAAEWGGLWLVAVVVMTDFFFVFAVETVLTMISGGIILGICLLANKEWARRENAKKFPAFLAWGRVSGLVLMAIIAQLWLVPAGVVHAWFVVLPWLGSAWFEFAAREKELRSAYSN